MAKKYLIYFLISFVCFKSFSQTITNLIMVGPKGVTEDPKIATAFIVVKQYPDSHFERLDYKKGGPLVKVRSYKDSDLKILNGRYFEYAPDGSLSLKGNYLNNAKNDRWDTYNDTGKIIKSVQYFNDSIVEIIDLDKKNDEIIYPDEKKASYPGGLKEWLKYLKKSLENENTVDKSFQGGKVIIDFVVEKDGSIVELFVFKSVEYILDETSLKIIQSSQKWNPAFQNGNYIRKHLSQPITFNK